MGIFWGETVDATGFDGLNVGNSMGKVGGEGKTSSGYDGVLFVVGNDVSLTSVAGACWFV